MKVYFTNTDLDMSKHITEREAIEILQGKSVFKLVKSEKTNWYVSNYYSRWAQGVIYYITDGLKNYKFIMYGRPKERESDADIIYDGYYGDSLIIELKEI